MYLHQQFQHRPWHVGAVAISMSKPCLQLDTVVVYVGIAGGAATFTSIHSQAALASLFNGHVVVPVRVVVIERTAFPLTSTGKTHRRQLLELYNQINKGNESAPEYKDKLTSILMAHLDMPSSTAAIVDEMTLVELGGNSLVATMVLHDLRTQCGLATLELADVLWSFATNDQIKCTPLVVATKQVVVCGSHDRHVYGLDIASGKCKFKLPFQKGYRQVVLYMNEPTLYSTCDRYPVAYCNRKSIVVASVDLGDAIFASPTMLTSEGDCGVCTTNGMYYVWDTWSPMWQAQLSLGGHAFSSPVAHDNAVYVGTRANKLLCIQRRRHNTEAR
ncbi:hypothetical protein B5M09_000021 [Aphanomyces astaci]|uniref:Uncharacterized protein n=1 Tax=Aphanomyces astaci TaxID=112090 RepID=A0A3R7X279_APHAT|nr:hypothetical protein B5M09_000021 [Aphanomyces astaci]